MNMIRNIVRKGPSLPLRPAPLAVLTVLALAALAIFASPGVGQAQGNPKTPSAPTITLFGCTNGCIAVDVALSTFTDGTAFNFAKYFSRQQVYPTTKMVPDTSKCETVTHRYFDYKGDPNPKVTTGINVGVGDAAPGLGDDLPDWVRAAASKAVPMVWDADTNAYKLPSLTGAKDRVRVWDIYPKRYQPTADEEAARARYGNNYCVHPEAQVREQRLIVEMQWRHSSDDNWQNWRRQQSPAYTGVRFQSLTRRGQFEVRNLEYNTAYQVRARVHHNGTDGEWSEPQTFTTKPFPAVQNFHMKVNPEGVTLSWDDPPSDDPGFDNHPNGFDGYFVAVNANGQCECGVATVPGETWASWVTGNSVTVKGFNPGQTVQACIRPAIGSRGGTTQRSANKTIGWPAGTVAGVPGAPGAPSLGYGEMFGSTKAPPYGYAGEVSLWDHYADIGDVPTQYPPLLDWDRLYITWDRAAQNGAYITKSEWQYRERGTSEWLHGGSVEGRTKRWGIHEKQVWEDPNTIAQRVLTDGVVYEFRVRSRSSAGWGPWSVITEFLNYTKKGTPGPVKDLRVHQPKAHAPSNERWTIAWAHPDYTGGYVQTDGKWGYASIKTYQITVTQPGRVEPLRLENPDRPGYTDGWSDGKWTMTFDMSPTCRANDIPDFFYPCSHERTGFQVWLTEQVDVTKPLLVTVRAQNNTAHQGWSVTELEYTPVGPPSAPRNLNVTIDETDVRDGIPTGLHRMSWNTPADDGGAPVHYLFDYSCTVLGGDQGNNRVEDLSYAREGTVLKVRNPELSRNRPGTLRCDWIEVRARNSAFHESAPVRWTAPPRESAPYVINPLGEITMLEGETLEIDLSRVFHDPNGDEFTVTREVVAGDETDVSRVSDDLTLTVTAPEQINVCEDVNGTYTCRVGGGYHITLYADDGNRNYGRGGRSEPHRFRVMVDARPEVITFDPMVYDKDKNGFIDRHEFLKARQDFVACREAEGYNDPGNPLECNTGETGHPTANFAKVNNLFNATNVDVTLTWGDNTSRDAVVQESVGEISVSAELPSSAPSGGMTLTVQQDPNNVGDYQTGRQDPNNADNFIVSSEIEIAAGTTTGSVTLKVTDDARDETDEKFRIVVTGVLGERTIGGVATLKIIDNDEAVVRVTADDPMALNAGAQGSYTMVLGIRPFSDVVITPYSNEPGSVQVQPASHTFTIGNWNQPATFNVLAAENSPTIGNISITHSATSTDSRYHGINIPSVSVDVTAANQRQSPVNHVPTVASPITDIASLEVGATENVSLSGVFSYDGDGALTIEARSSDTDVAGVVKTTDGSSLTVSGKAAGTATIAVVAQDPDGDRATDEFTVTIVAAQQQQQQKANSAPTVSAAIADGTIVNESGTHRVPLSGVFSDADQDTLTITAKSSATATATVSVATDQSALTVTAKKRGSATITVTANDGKATVDDTFTIQVKAAPVVASALADITGLEIEDTRTPSLTGVFSDADGDAITVTQVASSETSKVSILSSINTAADGSISITGFTLTAKDSGTATITVTAQDSDGNTVNDTFDVTVNAPQQQKANNAPTVASAIDDATIIKENGTKQVSLSGVFTDADADSLTLTAVSSSASVATVSVAADYSSLTVTAKARGTTTITVTASDGSATVEDKFDVTVKSAPAVASAIPDMLDLVVGQLPDSIDLTKVFSDADGDTLTFSTSLANYNVAWGTPFQGMLDVAPVAIGTVTFTVTAEDSDENSVSDSFDVTVVNSPPTVANAISDATIASETGTKQVSLSGVFDDVDYHTLTMTAESSDTAIATVEVATDQSSLTVTAKKRGTATITVTANDGNGGSVDDTFTVKVKAAPVVASAIPDVGGLAIDDTHQVSLSGVFSDADGDALTVTAASSKDAVATVVVATDQSSLTLTGKGEGTATITVTARDSDGNSVSDAFDVTVPAAQQQQQQAVELPGPVISLELTATADSVTVSWSAPETGGAPDGYIVHLRPENGEKGSGKTKRPKAKKTQVKFNNLQSGQTYQVWVRAQNEAGKGERVHATITLPESGDDQSGQ